MGCLRAPRLMEVGAWTESITSENPSTKPWSRRIQLAFPIAIKLLESEMNTETNYIYSCLANLITHFSQIKCIFRVYKEATIAKFVLQKQLKVNKSKTTRTFSNKTIAKIGKKKFQIQKNKKANNHIFISRDSFYDFAAFYTYTCPDQIHLPLLHRRPRKVWQPRNPCCQKVSQKQPVKH